MKISLTFSVCSNGSQTAGSTGGLNNQEALGKEPIAALADQPQSLSPEETWGGLLAQAKFMQRRLVYLGGGVAGLGIYGADAIGSDIFKTWPWLRAAFVILALSAGAFIGWAWEPCARYISRIERDHMGELNVERSPDERFPFKVLVCNNIALILLSAAAAVLISASILSALDNKSASASGSKQVGSASGVYSVTFSPDVKSLAIVGNIGWLAGRGIPR
jgi:hypothetical protein